MILSFDKLESLLHKLLVIAVLFTQYLCCAWFLTTWNWYCM